ncbi:hypothetical protein AVEN_92281-1 [Araneus ventricosus]|uniref:Uncharacterized protein n=1 Tax=Araneus ventricosus TaxID=182803 RepID=A0A4Y2AN01_ARAVE|nr:hypothetical protein AVEN_92281-1 [Araneus ventricosus]
MIDDSWKFLEAVATEIPRTPSNPRASTTGPLLTYAVCKGEQSTSEHLRPVKAGNLVDWREANLRWGKPHQSPDPKTPAAPPEVFPKVRLPFLFRVGQSSTASKGHHSLQCLEDRWI